MSAIVRQAFGARITDTFRPQNANYGARNSWHKVGQAVDFVPAGGVMATSRTQIRAVMAANGVRLIELLGPGDRGHNNHWHVAFALAGQTADRTSPENDTDWTFTAATTPPKSENPPVPANDITPAVPAPALATRTDEKEPPQWDVFAVAEWRASHGGR